MPRRSGYYGKTLNRAAVKLLLAARDTPCCHYCARALPLGRLTIDHRIPIIRGGTDDHSNLVLACLTCNAQKGPMTDQEFREYGPKGGKFLILLDAGHYKPLPEWASWPKGQYHPAKLIEPDTRSL